MGRPFLDPLSRAPSLLLFTVYIYHINTLIAIYMVQSLTLLLHIITTLVQSLPHNFNSTQLLYSCKHHAQIVGRHVMHRTHRQPVLPCSALHIRQVTDAPLWVACPQRGIKRLVALNHLPSARKLSTVGTVGEYYTPRLQALCGQAKELLSAAVAPAKAPAKGPYIVRLILVDVTPSTQQTQRCGMNTNRPCSAC